MARIDRGEAWDKHVRRIGWALLQLERLAPESQDLDLELTDLRFKLDADNRTSVLLILKAMMGDEALVGFVGGADLSSVVIAAAKRLGGGGVKWREDRPWQG